jgi:hypothetical protein
MLCTGLKRLPAEVDAIALDDAWELFEHWQQWPPEHVLLRGFTGYDLRKGTGNRLQGTETDASEVSRLSALLGPAEKAPPHISDMVRWAEETVRRIG